MALGPGAPPTDRPPVTDNTQAQDPSRAPLAAIRVLTVSDYGAGPYASQLLAQLGADVIKVEDPHRGGDSSRRIPPYQQDNDSLYYQSLNRNKRSIALDLKSAAGLRAFQRIAAIADAVLTNIRPDAAARLGLRYDALRAVNPRIVCCSMSGWGSRGGKAADPAYDYLIQATTGAMSLTGEPGDPPVRAAVPWVDLATSFAAAFALVSAVLNARQTKIGRDVEVAMMDVAMSMWSYLGTWHLSKGFRPDRLAYSAHQSVVPSQVFKTADGYFIIMCQTQEFWRQLCEGMELPELPNDPRFASMADRHRNRDVLVPVLQERFLQRTTKQWTARLRGKVPGAPVHDFPSAWREYEAFRPEMIVALQHPVFGAVRVPGNPIWLSDWKIPYRLAPSLGQHTEEVLREAGMSEADIASLLQTA